MEKLDNAIKLCIDQDGATTLSEFRKGALRNLNGTAYNSFSVDAERLMLMLCVTSPDQIRLIEYALKNIDRNPEFTDWDETTIAQTFINTAMGPGLTYQERRNKNGDITTLLLCATNPDLIGLLEQIVKLSGR